MPDQNIIWHTSIDPPESKSMSFRPDASHHQTDSPGPPILLSTLSMKTNAHIMLPN